MNILQLKDTPVKKAKQSRIALKCLIRQNIFGIKNNCTWARKSSKKCVLYNWVKSLWRRKRIMTTKTEEHTTTNRMLIC